MKKLALFDMDGTLCDYMGQLKKDMEKLISPDEGPYDDLYDESKPWLKARMDLIKSQSGWWLNLPPIINNMFLYMDIVKMGFETEILTKGPRTKRNAWMEKGEWVDRHISPDIPLNVVGKDKSKYYGHVLVEDYPEYLLGWLEHRPRGLGIIVDTEYNRDFTHPNVVRYDGSEKGWQKIKPYLQAVLDRQDSQHWKECM